MQSFNYLPPPREISLLIELVTFLSPSSPEPLSLSLSVTRSLHFRSMELLGYESSEEEHRCNKDWHLLPQLFTHLNAFFLCVFIPFYYSSLVALARRTATNSCRPRYIDNKDIMYNSNSTLHSKYINQVRWYMLQVFS